MNMVIFGVRWSSIIVSIIGGISIILVISIRVIIVGGISHFSVFFGFSGDFEKLITISQLYGGLETVDTGYYAEASLGATREASGARG